MISIYRRRKVTRMVNFVENTLTFLVETNLNKWNTFREKNKGGS